MRQSGWPNRLLLTAALGVVCCKPAPPPAPTTTTGGVDPLPYTHRLSNQQLAERFMWLEFHPLENKNLYFRLRVPRGWRARPSEINRESLRQREVQEYIMLAEVGPPASPDNRDSKDNTLVRVSYLRGRDGAGDGTYTSLTEPLQMYVTGLVTERGTFDPLKPPSNWTVISRAAKGRIGDRKFLDELVEISDPSLGLSTARMQVSRGGEAFFMLMAQAPSQKYDRLSQDFGVVLESFTPLYQTQADKPKSSP